MSADPVRAAARDAAAEALLVPRAISLAAGELRVSGAPTDRFTIHGLGSCLGVTVYDPVARVGGLLHAALPLSSGDPDRARRDPGVFVDSGVAALFRASYTLGARKERMILTVAGGAASTADEGDDGFQIGRRNLVVFRKLLWKNGVLLHAQDVGGTRVWRTISLDIGTGRVSLKMSGADRTLWTPGQEGP